MPEMNREDRGGRAPLPGNGNSPAPPAAPAAATAASGDAGSDHTQGTAAEGSGGQHAADETSAVTGDTASQGKNAHTAPDTAGKSAAEAGIAALKAVWGQASTLVPLLAAFSYGLGRLMVDGFYGQLHTTAEAAGLGYGAILEPAAILLPF
jgi:hypothetical protein